ncbi:MAG: hypothetical protein NWP98_10435 [Erythrobacter sp.]|nr:hypothetical protein [Erythrobacter sp.]
MRLLIAASLVLTLAACGEERARAPGTVSEGEAKALDAAAAMLDQRRLPPEALPPESAQPQPAPADKPASTEMTGDTAVSGRE